MWQTNGLSGGNGGRNRGNSNSSRDDSDEARSGGSSSEEVRARGGLGAQRRWEGGGRTGVGASGDEVEGLLDAVQAAERLASGLEAAEDGCMHSSPGEITGSRLVRITG